MNTCTKSNQETIDALQKAYSEGNLNAALDCMDEKIIWDISGPASVPYTGVYYGHFGFSAFWKKLGQTVAIGQAAIDQLFFNNDTAVGIGGEEGTVKANGAPYHYDWAVFYRFNANHQIIAMRQYYDPSRIQSALEAHPYPQS